MQKPFITSVLMSLCALATFAATILLADEKSLAIAFLVVLSACMLFLDWGWDTMTLYLGVFFLGPFSEIVCIHSGLWHYAQPDFLGIPAWLPFLWGNAALFILQLKKQLALLAPSSQS